jgi:glycosyltransferase involved in cell wall biosynthesis
MQPLVFPLYDSPGFRTINDRILRRQILNGLRAFGATKPIVITANPLMNSLLGDMEESSSYYLCLDDYALLPGVFKSLRALEEETLAKVTGVFAVSESLQGSRRPRSGESHFLPQGVDTNLFVHHSDHCPEVLRNIPRPIIGFHGLVSDWVDVALISRVAQAFPAASIVVVGRIATDVAPLTTRPNVLLLGPVAYQNLPRYSSMFDVGLIPFKLNELTLACNPLKLLEYFAMGMPVVSTELPEVRRFSPYAAIAADEMDFVRLVGEALGEDKHNEIRRLRRTVAEQHSWDSVTETMSGTMERLDNDQVSQGDVVAD